MKQGFLDYLEVLQRSGIADWGPFTYSPEDAEKIKSWVRNEAGRMPLGSQASSLQEAGDLDAGKMPVVPGNETATLQPPAIQEMPRKPAPPKNRASALATLAAAVALCEQCPELAEHRTQTVFGTGNPNAKLVFLGEAPGADEDKQGVPFVGRAGQLLNDMITKGMKLQREDVYICNILRCRPPGNRNPDPTEATNCRAFLDRTLEIIQPKYLCCLGAVAAQNLLATEQTIGNLRGQVYDYKGIKVVCTYHPAYLLRSPDAKGKAWEDLKLLMREMGLMER